MRKQNKIQKCRILSYILLGSFLLLSGCSKETVENQTTNMIYSTNQYVLDVKGGTNSNYPNVTYEEAFEDFFSDTSWRYFNGTQDGPDEDGNGEPDYSIDNVDVVEFSGYCTYMDVNVKALIQFIVEEDTFEAVYLSFNEVPQNLLLLDALITKVFESYTESISSEEISVLKESEKTDDVVDEERRTEIYLKFTQVDVYDHSKYEYLGEYLPKIYLYSDETFEFICNYYEEMVTWTGWWKLEAEVPKTYHCYIDNCSYLQNLDFYLYHNDSRCDAEFYSDWEEFGMTSMNDVLFHVEEVEKTD